MLPCLGWSARWLWRSWLPRLRRLGSGCLLAGTTGANWLCPACLSISSRLAWAFAPGDDRRVKGKWNYVGTFSDPCFVKTSDPPVSKASLRAEVRIKMARGGGSPQSYTPKGEATRRGKSWDHLSNRPPLPRAPGQVSALP